MHPHPDTNRQHPLGTAASSSSSSSQAVPGGFNKVPWSTSSNRTHHQQLSASQTTGITNPSWSSSVSQPRLRGPSEGYSRNLGAQSLAFTSLEAHSASSITGYDGMTSNSLQPMPSPSRSGLPSSRGGTLQPGLSRSASSATGYEYGHRQEYDALEQSNAASSWINPAPQLAYRNRQVPRDEAISDSQDDALDINSHPPSAFGQASEIVLALNLRGRKLGCAYFDNQLKKLFMMQDMQECGTDIIEKVKAQVRPTLIITSSRMDEKVMEALKFDDLGQETKVEIRPSGDFAYQMAKSKLMSVAVQVQAHRSTLGSSGTIHTAEMEEAAHRQARTYLSNLLDLDSTESIGCAGATISFLSRHGLSQGHARNERSGLIFDLASFSLESFMFINTNAMSSLQIFEDESHPSMHSSVRGRKEGLSLFGIMNKTRTSQGRYLLRQWFLRPSLSLEVLHSRHQTIECFVRPENLATVDQFISCLGHVKNMTKVLETLHRKADVSDWQAILQFAYYSLKIHSLSHDLFLSEAPIIQVIQQQFLVQDLKDIGTFINEVVDFDESMTEGRCVVKHRVDEDLDQMRKNYHGLDSLLSEIAQEISLTIPSEFTSTINVIYFPQLGYLITVPMNPQWKTEQDFQLEGLSYQFSTETTVYYKNSVMRDLDEHLGDIHGLIVGWYTTHRVIDPTLSIVRLTATYHGVIALDREIDILQELKERILQYDRLLIVCSDICAELDVLVSMAQMAKLRNYKRPTMTARNVLHIVNGRHPLQELNVDAFVTNSTQLGESFATATIDANTTYMSDQTATDLDSTREVLSRSDDSLSASSKAKNRVMILCGANCSGKTVYLKQVALITYMAHIGSFVPADSAIIGLTDKILTRLQTRETVSNLQSAFMMDLKQVALALRLATKSSLVILDEFGKGTTSTDGAGMFCGVIEHFASRVEDRPKVIATTHFHELFENQLLDFSLPISFYMMEIYQTAEDQEATFLFRVIPGKNPSSLGPACAASSGMPAHVVQRGAHLSKLFRRYEMVIPNLSEHEHELLKMYQTLVTMLLDLNLVSGHEDETASLKTTSESGGGGEEAGISNPMIAAKNKTNLEQGKEQGKCSGDGDSSADKDTDQEPSKVDNDRSSALPALDMDRPSQESHLERSKRLLGKRKERAFEEGAMATSRSSSVMTSPRASSAALGRASSLGTTTTLSNKIDRLLRYAALVADNERSEEYTC